QGRGKNNEIRIDGYDGFGAASGGGGQGAIGQDRYREDGGERRPAGGCSGGRRGDPAVPVSVNGRAWQEMAVLAASVRAVEVGRQAGGCGRGRRPCRGKQRAGQGNG